MSVHMKVRSRKKSLALLVGVLLILLPVALWLATAESRRIAVEVQQLIGAISDPFLNESTVAHNRLIALGPKAYPELRRILLSRANAPAGWYERIWNRVPPGLRTHLPQPALRASLRRKLQELLPITGPVICRAMTGALCAVLENGDANGNEMPVLRALEWSIPESIRAVTTLSNYLARPDNNFLFGSTQADELWLRVPHFAPMLAQWLRNENTVHDAARGLARLGTNAAFAVPMLVEAAESGLAQPPAFQRITVSYGPFDHTITRRMVAIQALGSIGTTNSTMIHVLNKAAESGKNDLASSAYLAALQLELPVTGPLQAWADNWNPFEEFSPQFYRAAETIRALGKLGSKGVPAIELLDRIASGTGTNAAARFDHFDPRQATGMRLAAISSLYQVAPDRAAPYFSFALEHSANFEAMNLLRQWRARRDEIVPAILKHLDDPGRRLQAAFILHGVAPELEEPRRILESALTAESLTTRATAVNWLWRIREDADRLVPVARDLLKADDDDTLQSALNALENMGDAASPAVPELKPLLVSKSWGVRDRAGRLLRKLSPGDMPPIVE